MLIPDGRDDDKNNTVADDNDDHANHHDHDDCDVDPVDDKSQLRVCNWSRVITLGEGLKSISAVWLFLPHWVDW